MEIIFVKGINVRIDVKTIVENVNWYSLMD